MNRGRNMLQGVQQAEREARGDVVPADALQVPGKVFVGGLSWDTTPEDLHDYFAQFGECEAQTMKDKFSGHSRGFGFVTFKQPDTADRIVESKHVIHGRIVEAKLAVPRTLNPNGDKPKCRKVFVGGILSSVTEAELRSHFEQHGEVQEAQLMCEAATNRSRGFGFVTFADEKVAEEVLGGEHYLGGKRVEVKYAVPKSSMASRRNMTTAVLGGEGMMPFMPYMGEFPLGFGQTLYGQQIGAPMGYPNLLGMQIGMPNGTVMEFDANGVLVPSPPAYPGNTTDFPTPQQHQQHQQQQQQQQQGGSLHQQGGGYDDGHHHLQQLHDSTSTSSSSQQAGGQSQQQQQAGGQQQQQPGKGGVPPLMIVMPNQTGLSGSTLPSPNVYDPSLMYGGMGYGMFPGVSQMGMGYGVPYSPDLTAVMASMASMGMN